MSKEAGRPIEYTEEVLNDIENKMEEYTDSTDLPILAEFAYQNGIRRSVFYEHEGLSYARERMLSKKEAALERGGLSGEYIASITALSLKQLGWKDKPVEQDKSDKAEKLVEALNVFLADEA